MDYYKIFIRAGNLKLTGFWALMWRGYRLFRTFAPAAARISGDRGFPLGRKLRWQKSMTEISGNAVFRPRRECVINTGLPAATAASRSLRLWFPQASPQTASVIVGLDSEFPGRAVAPGGHHSSKLLSTSMRLHFGSWRKKAEKEDGWYSYEGWGLQLPYLKEGAVYSMWELLRWASTPATNPGALPEHGLCPHRPLWRRTACAFVDQCHQNGVRRDYGFCAGTLCRGRLCPLELL